MRLAALVAAGLAAAVASSLPASADVRAANVMPDMVGSRVVGIDSPEAKAVYCRLVADGFNSVVLTWAIEQTSKTSGRLVPRTAAPGRAPTPTDVQIVRAVRNAKACGVKYVTFKEHIWLPGNEWRAHIPGTTKNQEAWTKRLLHLQRIALDEGVHEIVIGTELKNATTTKGDTARWKATVKTLRKVDPKHKVRLTYAGHGTRDETLKLGRSFVRSLDAVYATYYPRPQDGQHLSESDLLADMRKDRPDFERLHDRFGSRFDGFAETGFRDIDYRDYYKPSSATVRPDQGLQARQYRAFFTFVDSMPYLDTFMLYRAQAGRVEPGDFTWQGKQAERVIRDEFTR